jgi:hypothetical protein
VNLQAKCFPEWTSKCFSEEWTSKCFPIKLHSSFQSFSSSQSQSPTVSFYFSIWSASESWSQVSKSRNRGCITSCDSVTDTSNTSPVMFSDELKQQQGTSVSFYEIEQANVTWLQYWLYILMVNIILRRQESDFVKLFLSITIYRCSCTRTACFQR